MYGILALDYGMLDDMETGATLTFNTKADAEKYLDEEGATDWREDNYLSIVESDVLEDEEI